MINCNILHGPAVMVMGVVVGDERTEISQDGSKYVVENKLRQLKLLL